jgi:hypothetical protein
MVSATVTGIIIISLLVMVASVDLIFYSLLNRGFRAQNVVSKGQIQRTVRRKAKQQTLRGDSFERKIEASPIAQPRADECQDIKGETSVGPLGSPWAECVTAPPPAHLPAVTSRTEELLFFEPRGYSNGVPLDMVHPVAELGGLPVPAHLLGRPL